MDGGRGPFSSAKLAESATNGPESIAQNKTGSPSTANSRHSPVTPLAPLEFLQNQRRGSITDPSLHAAGASGVVNIANSPPSGSKPRQPDPSATLGRYSLSIAALGTMLTGPANWLRNLPAKLQSSPPYRFGEASSAQPSESSSPNLRKILRSPTLSEGRRKERREGEPRQGDYACQDLCYGSTLKYRPRFRPKTRTRHETVIRWT